MASASSAVDIYEWIDNGVSELDLDAEHTPLEVLQDPTLHTSAVVENLTDAAEVAVGPVGPCKLFKINEDSLVSILEFLSWRSLGALDVAMTNRALRGWWLQSMNRLDTTFLLNDMAPRGAYTKRWGFALQWIILRTMRLPAKLDVPTETSDKALACLKECVKGHPSSQGVRQLFVKSFSAYEGPSTSPITDVTIERFQFLPLEVLDLDTCSNLTDKCLLHLKKLTKLKTLSFRQGFQMDGTMFHHLKCLTNLQSLDLSSCKDVTNNCLVNMKFLTALKTLDLKCCYRVTDKGMVHFSTMTSLTSLDVSFTKITDKGVEHALKNVGLKVFMLGGDKTTDAGIAMLKVLPQLEEIGFTFTAAIGVGMLALKACPLKSVEIGPNASEEGFGALQYFPGLRRLTVYIPDEINDEWFVHFSSYYALQKAHFSSCNKITACGFMYLSGCTSTLEDLNLHQCTGITDDGLAQVAKFTALKTLQIHSWRGKDNANKPDHVTDAGMVHLKSLTRLQTLSLGYRHNITDTGLAQLHGCKVLRDVSLAGLALITSNGLDELMANCPMIHKLQTRGTFVETASNAFIQRTSDLLEKRFSEYRRRNRMMDEEHR